MNFDTYKKRCNDLWNECQEMFKDGELTEDGAILRYNLLIDDILFDEEWGA